MMNANYVRTVCLIITVGLIITVLHIFKSPQSHTQKSKLSYPKPAKKASKTKAIETGIFLLINQLALNMSGTAQQYLLSDKGALGTFTYDVRVLRR